MFVAAQVSETLIRVDCRGIPIPGLAQSWSRDDTGNRWTFTLRHDARFSDGTLVTAADVARSFGEVSSPRPWVDDSDMLVGWAGIRRALVRGDSVIILDFDHPYPSVPMVVAHPALVAVRHTQESAVGSGSFTVGATTASQMRLDSPSGAAISLTVMDGDPRDALDAGVDVVITRDTRTLAYAAGLPDYQRLPLPWSEVYFLLRPRPGEGFSPPDRASMADIVPMDARPAGSDLPRWWHSSEACPLPEVRRAAPRQGEGHLVYHHDDPVARAVAERLVAVTERDLRALALGDTDYRRALGGGGDWGYIVRLPVSPSAPCLAVGQLLTATPWLSIAPGATQMLPLVETRWHAVVAVARVEGRVQIDHAGTLIVDPGR